MTAEEEFFTIDQLLEANGYRMPFWVKPWHVRYSYLLVKSFHFDSNGRVEFIADRYCTQKQKLYGQNLIIGASNQPCWQFA